MTHVKPLLPPHRPTGTRVLLAAALEPVVLPPLDQAIWEHMDRQGGHGDSSGARRAVMATLQIHRELTTVDSRGIVSSYCEACPAQSYPCRTVEGICGEIGVDPKAVDR